MIAFLDGTVAEKGPDRVVVAAGGIGYEVLAPTGTLAKLPATGRQVRLYTRMQVRDDAMVLYGFDTAEERGLFDHLVSVSGVGPKMALAVLSALSPDALRRAVAADDAAALMLAPGVGKKVAGRMLVDLKDRLGRADASPTGPLSEVRQALLSLGLSPQEAQEALGGLAGEGDRPVEEMLKEALRAVARMRAGALPTEGVGGGLVPARPVTAAARQPGSGNAKR
jgi:Holliday junction DNA helicase RuvA